MLPFDVLKMVKGSGGGSGGGGGSTGTINAEATSVLFAGPPAVATAAFSLNSDGTCTAVDSGSPAYWYDPITPGIGSSYWAIVTLTSGTVSSGTVGSRVSLASGQTWAVVGAAKSCSGTIAIYDAATGGNLLASGTFYLSAEISYDSP